MADNGQHASASPSKGLSSLLSFVLMVAFVLLLSLGLRSFVFVPYEIPSGSMEETIMPGDMVFSEKISYYFRSPEYKDIVTFADPTVAGRTLIKRVIATAGQTVDFSDGNVLVDGKVLDEPYTNGKKSYPLDHTAFGVTLQYPITIPDGEIWVMGDNRTASQDSRYFGPVEVSTVTGRASMIYWPIPDIKVLN